MYIHCGVLARARGTFRGVLKIVAKDEVYNLRWSAELRDRVKDYTKEHKYENMSSLIREAIEEKLNSGSEEEHTEKIVKKLFQKMEFRRDLGLK